MSRITLETVDQKLSDHITEEGVVWMAMKKDISEMSDKQNNANTTITITKTKMENIEETTNRIEKTLNDFIEKADRKFASKWVENFVYAIMLAFGTLIVGGVWAVITKRL